MATTPAAPSIPLTDIVRTMAVLMLIAGERTSIHSAAAAGSLFTLERALADARVALPGSMVEELQRATA